MKLATVKVPPWRWWMYTGERLQMGADVMSCFAAKSVSAGIGPGLVRVRQALASGRSLVEAMAASGWELSSLTMGQLEMGERTGRIGESFRQIAEQMRQQEQGRREWMAQLWYPALVGLVGCAVLLLLTWWVIPQMQAVAESLLSGQPLPWITRSIGWLYGTLSLCALIGAGVAIASSLCLRKLAAHSLIAGRLWQRLMDGLPLIGKVAGLRAEALLLGQISAYGSAGIALPEALTRIASALPNCWCRQGLLGFRDHLLMGVDFAVALKALGWVRADNHELLCAAQQAGRLVECAAAIARQSQSEANWTLQQASRAIEPLFLLGLSVAVGGLLLAYLLPLMRIFENFTAAR